MVQLKEIGARDINPPNLATPVEQSRVLAPADAGRPDHAMHQQIRGKVGQLDVANGRTFDATSERMTASLLHPGQGQWFDPSRSRVVQREDQGCACCTDPGCGARRAAGPGRAESAYADSGGHAAPIARKLCATGGDQSALGTGACAGAVVGTAALTGTATARSLSYAVEP